MLDVLRPLYERTPGVCERSLTGGGTWVGG